jgi:hypothetical protein
MSEVLSISDTEYINMIMDTYNIKPQHLNKKLRRVCNKTINSCDEQIFYNKGHYPDKIRDRLRTKLESRHMVC